jgi:hypothetical protein
MTLTAISESFIKQRSKLIDNQNPLTSIPVYTHKDDINKSEDD